jgi:hypothetical protein
MYGQSFNLAASCDWRRKRLLAVTGIEFLPGPMTQLASALLFSSSVPATNSAWRSLLCASSLAYSSASIRGRISSGATACSGCLKSLWERWSDALIIVKPETVVGWPRAGFRHYWRFPSRIAALGRPKIPADVYEMVKRIVRENPTWEAPQIHGELLKPGIAHFRTHDFPLSAAAHAGLSRVSPEMAGVFEKSPGGHRRYRFLHGANLDVRRALLLLRHRAPSEANSALQRDGQSEGRLDLPATARGVPTSGSLQVSDHGSASISAWKTPGPSW